MNKEKVFVDKIRSKSVIVGIIGMGYVGLPLAIEFADKGFPVIGFDIDSKKTESINKGRSYIKHIADEKVALLADSGNCAATNDFSRLQEVDCILICVPTPLTQHNEPDMQYITATVKSIARYLRPEQLVVLESTTYPGTTSVLVRDILEKSGLKAGEDFYLAFLLSVRIRVTRSSRLKLSPRSSAVIAAVVVQLHRRCMIWLSPRLIR